MKTIFVGGGTPTALNNRQLLKLVQMIEHYFDVDQVSEYTFEANPGDLTKEKIKILKKTMALHVFPWECKSWMIKCWNN